jgi:hypothetical protein
VSVTTFVAYVIIAAAFVSFFVMATITYGQFTLKAWRAMFMSMAVLLILLVIMRKATEIVTAERAEKAIEQQQGPSPYSK